MIFVSLILMVAVSTPRLVPAPMPIREVLRLSPDGQSPCVVRGIVTYVRPGENPDLIIEDSSGGLFLTVEPTVVEGLVLGTVVEAEGVLSPGNFSPRLAVRSIRSVGTATLPTARVAATDELMTGKLDCRRIELRGVIRTAEVVTDLVPPRAIVKLATPTGMIDLWILNYDAGAVHDLVDTAVEVSGVCLAWDTPKRQLRGVRLLVNDLRDMRVVRSVTGDPFDLPAVNPATFGRYSPDGLSLHRVKLRGVVTWHEPGQPVVVQVGQVGVRVRCSSSSAARPGDLVEVIGFPVVSGFSTELQDAICRVVGTGDLPTPVPMNAQQLGQLYDQIDYDQRVVRLRGTLQLIQPASGGSTLQLNADGSSFAAFLPGQPPSWDAGTELELTGVCELMPTDRILRLGGVADRFSLLLRDQSDVKIVRSGPWLNERRLSMAAGILVGVAMLTAMWAISLHRLVTHRTKRLVREVSARHDAEVGSQAVADERVRVAAELHDTLEQSLTGIALQVEAAELAGRDRPDRVAAHLELARGMLRTSRIELRAAIHDLRSPTDVSTLPAELKALADAMSPTNGPKIDVQIQGTPYSLPEAAAHHTLRVARELVTNAVKHAVAKSVVVELAYGPSAARLTVRDDGIGFLVDHDPPRSRGYGLSGLRDRAAKIGASVSITSHPGQGTLAVWQVPLSAGRGR